MSTEAAEATAQPPATTTPSQISHGAHAQPKCDNCGVEITGKYCSQCGQHYQPHIHSLGHFFSEMAENITHADSRLWLTLWPLLAKPGFLTKEFFDGRRSRYLPPFRLYLVVTAVFFLVWSSLPSTANYFAMNPNTHELIPLNEKAAGSSDAQKARRKLDSMGLTEQRGAHDADRKAAETPGQRADRVCEDVHYKGPGESFIEPRAAIGCKKIARDNGHEFIQAFIHNIPRSLFILLPALALLMKLMYWRPKHYYVEHLLFFIHGHAAVFLLLLLYFLLERLLGLFMPTWPLTTLLWLYIFYYLYKSMRRFYGQGKWLTRSKFLVLSFAYLVGASALLGFIALFSFMTF